MNGIDDLPLRLRCFWKCDPMVTNYRIDYKYNEAAVKGIPLTALAICVSVDGVVSRHLCKPDGKWYALIVVLHCTLLCEFKCKVKYSLNFFNFELAIDKCLLIYVDFLYL